MGMSKRILGGAMAGLGTGMVERAEEKRARAMEILKQTYQTQRDQQNFQNRKGLIVSVQRGEEGDMYGITGGGDKKDLGFRGAKSASMVREERLLAEASGEAGSGMSADDKRWLDAVKEPYTTTDENGNEVVDYAGLAQALKSQGRDDLAQIYEGLASKPKGIETDSPEYREAQRMAENWASDQAGWFSSDKSDFKEYGGSRSEAIKQKTIEIYKELTGEKPQSGGLMPSAETPAEQPAESGGEPEQGASQYKSAEDVKAAYAAGEITREEALRILRTDFGME